MATRIELTGTVDAPADELFDLLSNPELETGWNPDVIEVRRLDDGPVAPGARWEGRYKGMGLMRIRLDELQRPGRLVFTIDGDRLDMRFAFNLSPEGERTRMRTDAQVTPKGAMRLIGPLMGPMMRRTMAKRPEQMAAGVRRMHHQPG
jgi:uncharacterized protein YndB with AHSA1/START domain